MIWTTTRKFGRQSRNSRMKRNPLPKPFRAFFFKSKYRSHGRWFEPYQCAIACSLMVVSISHQNWHGTIREREWKKPARKQNETVFVSLGWLSYRICLFVCLFFVEFKRKIVDVQSEPLGGASGVNEINRTIIWWKCYGHFAGRPLKGEFLFFFFFLIIIIVGLSCCSRVSR